MHVELKKIISSLLTDEDPDTRRQAAEDLSEYDTITVIAALAIGLQDDKKGVRDAAFRSLGTIGGEKVARAVVEYIGDESIITRNLVAELLMKIGADAVPALLPFSQDVNPDIRKFAVDILGEIRSTDAVDSITPLLRDSDVNVCLSAIEALGNIGDSRPLKDLLSIYENDKRVRPAVAEAVGKIGDQGGARFLLGQYKKQLSRQLDDSLLGFTIIEALGKIGNKNALTYLYEFLPESSGKLQQIVLHAIVQISERLQYDLKFSNKDGKTLLHILENASDGILHSTIKALAIFAGDDITKAFIKKLGCSDTINEHLYPLLMDRRNAFHLTIELLEEQQIRDNDAILLLKKMAQGYVKRLYSGETVDIDSDVLHRAFAVVARHWETAVEETRAAIVDTLFTLDGDRAVLFLDKIVEDQDPWLRMHVIELLVAIADPRTPEFISRFLDDDDEMVREIAGAALQSKGYLSNESIDSRN